MWKAMRGRGLGVARANEGEAAHRGQIRQHGGLQRSMYIASRPRLESLRDGQAGRRTVERRPPLVDVFLADERGDSPAPSEW